MSPRSLRFVTSRAFLDAYRQAHPRSIIAVQHRPRGRQAHLQLPDFGDDKKNAAFDELLETFLSGVTRLMAGKTETEE
jgi:hypothetical protein